MLDDGPGLASSASGGMLKMRDLTPGMTFDSTFLQEEQTYPEKQNLVPEILIVDDIKMNRMVLKKLLGDVKADLVEAENGEQALKKVVELKRLALILLDIQMPVMDGYEVARVLQNDDITRHIPIIFVTAMDSDDDDIIKGYTSGAIDYITKPIKKDILRAKTMQFIEMWRLRFGLEQEIKHRRELEEKNLFLANHDLLTMLPNRRSAYMHLERAMEGKRKGDGTLSVIFIDLDGFKIINDVRGHKTGDLVLKTIAKRFVSNVRSTDMIARIGGDEFIAIINNIEAHNLLIIVEKLLHEASRPISVSENDTVRVSASIGICNYDDPGLTPEEILANADMAMYKAKERGKNQFYFYSREMNKEAHRRLRTENQLKHCIERQEISTNYQPIVRVEDGSLFGVESLIRWHNEELGVVSPDYFIPIAESSGDIHDIGNWVFERSIIDLNTMIEHVGFPIVMAINASTLQFQSSQWYNVVKRAVDEKRVDPQLLEVEITERLLLDDSSNVNKRLHDFKDLGVHLSVDDFGTGYSALTYLKRCPVSIVKIDRGFIRDTPHEKDDMVLVRAIIAMAHGLGLEVIAEGVETKEQWEFLKAEKCDYAQGYYFSKPLSVDDFLLWVDEYKDTKRKNRHEKEL